MSIVVGVAFLVLAVGIPAYAYAGYPFLLRLLPARGSKPQAGSADQWPAITIILPVHNEAAVVAQALESLLNADYPADRRTVLVVSDASNDGTDDVVRGFADRGVELVRLPVRGGKTAAENAAAGRVHTGIVVNTDASVRLHPGALKPLVAAFSDPTVGIASGRDVSVGSDASLANLGESGYVGYEMWVRRLETRCAGIVGASGCFFASRQELQGEIVPEALSRDFAAPLVAREHGYRSVSIDAAVCFVPRAGSLRQEYRRKVRTMSRGLQTLFFKRHLLNPLRHGRFAWMLWSHKLIRWLVPFAAMLGLAGIWLVAAGVPGGRAAVVGLIAASAGIAAAAWWWPGGAPPRMVAVPGYLLWGLTAGWHAWFNVLRGDLTPTWEPTRR
jgi:cellulose synthase/poly-beta-1,6-N-acetylglucosamine synthase-like glycosyltransferase